MILPNTLQLRLTEISTFKKLLILQDYTLKL